MFEWWYFSLEREVNMAGKKSVRLEPEDAGLEALNDLAEEATLNHLHHRNLLFLEATISAMLDVHDARDVATILREHADQLEAYL